MYTATGTIDKSHLLEQYLPIVRRIAARMMARLPANVELDDLIQAGRIGLLEACTRYRENTAATFETFASQRIRGAILDELRAADWVPRRVRQAAREIEEALRAAAHRVGRAPSEAEVAQEMHISLDEYHERLVKIQGCQLVYAEDCRSEESDRSAFDDRADEAESGSRTGRDPMALLLSGELRGKLTAAIGELPEREAQVLSMYYDDEMNMREIASVLGVNPSRASQLHNQALVRLRAMLAELAG